MDLSIIIVSWNVRDKLKDNLASLFASRGDFSFEVFVSDNASSDGTVEMIKRDFPRVKIIANDVNLGFAKANNQALKRSSGDWLLLLNPDMRFGENSLRDFLGWLKDNKPAIAGCKLVDEQGRLVRHVRRFPTLMDQLAIAAKLPHLFPKILDRYLATDFNYDRAMKVDSIRGSFFAIKRSTYAKLGGLDERYFLWFEEVDYCRQAREVGLEVWYAPVATVTDYVGQSFQQINREAKQKYFKESMLKYFAKWHGPASVMILRLAWLLGDVVVGLAGKFKIKSRVKT